MSKLNKFEDVDVFASLNAIMKQNTGFFQSDFDIDREIIAKAAASASKEDKTLLWFCRPSGTHCFRERDVFLKDTAPHNTSHTYHRITSLPAGFGQCFFAALQTELKIFVLSYNPIAASSSCSLHEMSRQLLLDIQLSWFILGSPLTSSNY